MMLKRCSALALILVLAVSATARAETPTNNYYVGRSEDDAEDGANGEVNPASDDLDLRQHSGFESAVALGMRFDGIRVAKGRKIKRAFVQFTKDGNRRKAEPTHLTIHAQLVPDAKAFKEEPKNITSRKLTETSVKWSPQPWEPTAVPAEKPRTPDLSAVIQEVVDQDGWKEGNALVLIVTGTGERDAVSFDGGGKENGPMLRVETE